MRASAFYIGSGFGIAALVLISGCDAPSATDTSPEPVTQAPQDKAVEAGNAAGAEASDAGVTRANYDRLKTGMTLAEVSAILGGPAEQVTETEAGGTTMSIHTWTEGMLSGKALILTFTDGKLDSKTQTGF